MQIEFIVESVEIDEVTEESVTVYPIGEAVEKNDKDKMTTQLIVQKDEAAEVPFTAIIRRTSELGQQEFEERGVWKGVMVFKTMLEVTEERL